MKHRKSLIIFETIMTLAGGSMMKNDVKYHRYSSESHTWPTTQATITTSRIQLAGSKKSRLRIEYVYHVEGDEYSGTRVTFGAFQANSKQTVTKYPKHAVVPVHDHPENHGIAVLEPGT